MESSFKKRLLTAVVGVPVIILLLLAPKMIITIAVMVVSCIGLHEYYRAVGLSNYPDVCILGYIASFVLSVGTVFSTGTSLTLVYVYIVILFVFMLLSVRSVGIIHIGMLLLGLIYIPYFLSHITYIRAMDFGNFYIWLVFIGAFMTDTWAYFIGCRFGKHKLCPKISPQKSVEGAVAGVIGGGLSFVIFGLVVNLFFTHLLGGGHMHLGKLFVLGLIAAVMSEIGDLVASSIKRQFNIKDFGTILPGHGGILDRCDSIILVAPVIFLFLYNVSIVVY